MRVLINGWFAGRPVGSGRYVDRLATALPRVAPDWQWDVLAPQEQRRALGPLGKVLFEQVTVPRRARAYDLLFVPYWGPPAFSPCPVIVTVHDLIPVLLPEYRRDPRVNLYSQLAAAGTARAAAVIADSEHTRRDVVRHLDVDPDQVFSVPLGVDARFRPDPAQVAFGDLDLPPTYALYVGGHDPRKRVDDLLVAWSNVLSATGVPLVIVGPGAVAGEAEQSESPIHRLPTVDEALLPGLYAGSRLFVYPSAYEGFGLPPLEAMACGVPVIARAGTSVEEVVGPAGVLLPHGAGPEVWAEAATTLLLDPAKSGEYAATGLRRAAGFTWEAAARRIVDVFETVGRP